jgi:BirA family biotin operon repressor/biotin-[acetyl-CoA-carboxylase] ligase
MAGVALAKALADSHDLAPALKWPNDVLLGGKKVSGILSEAAKFPDGPAGAVLGIGVNCSQESFPRGLAHSATSIRIETGAGPRTRELFSRLLVYLNAGKELLYLGEGRVVADEWRSLSATLGQEVGVELSRARRVSGRAVDIDDHGCLIVDAEGETVRVVAGDVVHLRTG